MSGRKVKVNTKIKDKRDERRKQKLGKIGKLMGAEIGKMWEY